MDEQLPKALPAAVPPRDTCPSLEDREPLRPGWARGGEQSPLRTRGGHV